MNIIYWLVITAMREAEYLHILEVVVISFITITYLTWNNTSTTSL